MKKIFLTGAPGWLGSRCVDLMANKTLEQQREDYQLRCLVLPGMETDTLKRDKVEIVPGNVADAATLKGTMDGCDAAVHMVGIIHPKKIADLYAVNYEGTRNVLEEAIRAKVKRLVFISSNSPAGFSAKGKPHKEGDKPNPYMNYGKSKYQSEQMLLEACRENKIEVVILRPCWYYGPGQPARQTTFFKMIQKGNPIMFGSGENMRSVSYVDSVVQGIVLALETEKANGQIYWIADERPYSSNEIYETIAKLLKVEKLSPRKIPGISSWVFEQADRVIQAFGMYQQEIHVAGEMSRDIACDISKAKAELGYRPLTDLEEGMRRSIEWCRQNGVEI